MESFADWLRSARSASGFSQDRLAKGAMELDENSAIYQARVTAWENAKDLPSLRQWALMCLVLKLPPDAVQEGRRLLEEAHLSGLPMLSHGAPESDGTLDDAPSDHP